MDPKIQKKLDSFFCRFRKYNFKKGEILIRAGDTPDGIFYLKNGAVREYAISQKGEELVVNIFKSSSFFPLSHAFYENPNQYFYEAMVPVEAWRAPKEEVLQFLKDNPDVMLNLLSRIYKGLDGLLNRVVYLMGGNAYERLITELIIYAKRFGGQEGEVEVKISEKDLAAQSGMTRETVSREIKILKKNNLVYTKDGHLVIPDVKKLEDLMANNI